MNRLTNGTIQKDEMPDTTDALVAQAAGLVERLRLDHCRDEQVLPAFGLSEKQVQALCGAAVATAVLALAAEVRVMVGEVRALRLALCPPRLPRRP